MNKRRSDPSNLTTAWYLSYLANDVDSVDAMVFVNEMFFHLRPECERLSVKNQSTERRSQLEKSSFEDLSSAKLGRKEWRPSSVLKRSLFDTDYHSGTAGINRPVSFSHSQIVSADRRPVDKDDADF